MSNRSIRGSYYELLKTDEWKEFRKEVLEQYNHECCWCGETKRLNVHHKVYIDGRYPWEYSMKEVCVYCKDCHTLIHESADYIWASCLKMDPKVITTMVNILKEWKL